MKNYFYILYLLIQLLTDTFMAQFKLVESTYWTASTQRVPCIPGAFIVFFDWGKFQLFFLAG